MAIQRIDHPHCPDPAAAAERIYPHSPSHRRMFINGAQAAWRGAVEAHAPYNGQHARRAWVSGFIWGQWVNAVLIG
ncbi:MAG: hypothetical protein WBD74_02875 [Candidatus Aquilonibacter sp.]